MTRSPRLGDMDIAKSDAAKLDVPDLAPYRTPRSRAAAPSRDTSHLAPARRRRPASRSVIPLPPENAVVRARLNVQLDRGVQGPLTLVSAPAGTGKTVAVAAWARSRSAHGPVLWMSLSELDLKAGVPWSLINAELAGVGVATPLTPSATPGSTRTTARAIAAHGEPVTVILDCASELSTSSTRGLQRLIAERADSLRLVLLTRSDPALPVEQYREENTVVEVRLSALAFTHEEAHELFSRRGVELAAEDMRLVMRRTRGWAAGLLLVAMTLARDSARGARDLDGSSGTIGDYLLAEVLNRQSPSGRALLLHSSVVEVLRPGLIQALAGPHAQDTLEHLTRENSFVEPMPGRTGWYRLHPLFRDLLRAELIYEEPEEGRRLYLAAADWSARAGLLTDAVRSAIEAEAWVVAAGYVIEQLAVAELLTPNRTALSELFASMPDETAGAAAALIRAALAARDRRAGRCADELDRARTALPLDGPLPGAAVTVAVISAVRAALGDDPNEVLAAAATADDLLAAEDAARVAAHPGLAIVLNTVRSRALMSHGQLAAAAHYCTAVAAGGIPAGFERHHLDCLGNLALMAAWCGQNRRAARLVRRALTLQSRADLHHPAAVAAAEAGLAWVYVETGDLARARRHAAAAGRGVSDRALGDVLRVSLALLRSRIRRAEGDFAGARAALSDCRERETGIAGWLKEWLTTDESIIDELAGLTDASGAAARHPETDRTLTAEVERCLREARRHVRRGDESHAAESLDEALELAAPERLRRPFHEAPADVWRVLHTRREVVQRHAWLAAQADGGPFGGGRSR